MAENAQVTVTVGQGGGSGGTEFKPVDLDKLAAQGVTDYSTQPDDTPVPDKSDDKETTQRGPDGRFAAQDSPSKGEDADAGEDQQPGETEDADTEGDSPPPIAAPRSWTAEDKELFASLPRET